MIDYHFFTGLIIHLIIPLLGFLYFVYINRKIVNENVPDPPTIPLFFIFLIYGILLIIILTGLFWEWSGMASLGAIFLVTIAPVFMAIIASSTKADKRNSKYHLAVYRLSIWYFIVIPIFILLVLNSQ